MKIISTTLAGLMLGATSVAGVAAASTAQGSATVQIRHQVGGCHTWSVNGSAVQGRSDRQARARGAPDHHRQRRHAAPARAPDGPRVVYTLTNPGSSMMGALKAPYASGMMPHTGAALQVTFAKKGTYTFKTVAGEDYMKGIKTTGKDNVLELVVTVS